ncbi:hypothetical protein BU26DRAFT_436844 [Trematosphaeria pertusa]|uniref:YAG7-like dimerisation domain-containing protein n=1 Tax=Trematosphaeria pertusa TaxID=390896 RepID=A0A6A6HYD4_9PLEO|nr:uncharacterized protein BU26DRAFT_436844 [Trematosphaeria pertusa]KAF2243225.1 hypothetical protein BU26DRAFT_436844 [Trematosphaeria pertusa]
MSSDVVSNPQAPAPGESKSARKKKAKAAAAVPAPTEKPTSELGAGSSDPAGKANGAESDNSYIRELQKNVRNVNKKLNNIQRVEAILEANPGASPDELVASRKINADQKAQLDKKPSLQGQLAQLEEQLSQYKKFDQEYQNKIAQEKELLQKSYSEELETLRDTLKTEAVLEQKKIFREKFLTLSRFLRAAAARRQLEEDDSDLTKAFEGALLLVYGGDAQAVAAAEKLIDGTDDNVSSTEGVALSVTCTYFGKFGGLRTDAQIKQAALDEAPFAAEEAWVDDVAQAQPAPPETEATPATSTDPTIANAGLTEIDTGVAAVNGGAESAETPSAPPASSIDDGAANAAATEQWDKQRSGSDDPLAESYEMVPRDPTETESPAVAAPMNSVQSWADDTPEPAPTTTPAPANGNDGFHEVHHSRGGRGRGGPQGEGRGGFRGRGGPRGDYRGRGRGGRGRGEFRGGPRGSYRGRGESQ